MWLARGPSRCDRGEHWRRSRTEQSRAEQSRAEQNRPCSGGGKDRESRPSVTTACLSGAACLQLRWNQGEICAALIMSLVWIINESCSPGTRAPTEPINPPNTPTCTHTHTQTHTRTLMQGKKGLRNTHIYTHRHTHTQWRSHIMHSDTDEQQAC